MTDTSPNVESLFDRISVSSRMPGDVPLQERDGARLASDLWENSNAPAIFESLLQQSDLTERFLVDALLFDMLHRWSIGQDVPAELYCRRARLRFPELARSVLFELPLQEFLIRQELTNPDRHRSLAEFVDRFPEVQDELLAHFDEVTSIRSDLDMTCNVAASEVVTDTIELARPSDEQDSEFELTTIEFDELSEATLAPNEDSGATKPGDSFLASCRPFDRLPDVLVREIEEQMEAVQFSPGEHLIRQGEDGDGLYLIVRGHVEIRLTDSTGQPRVLAKSRGSEIVGEMALLTDEPRTADVAAVTDVSALFLPADRFDELATRYPLISKVLTRLLAERLGREGHDALAGKTLGRYRILSRLGKGGMAIVYRAEDIETQCDVALKMMSHRLVYDANALRLFQREAQIIEQFDHPNIVRMLDRFRAFRSFFIVMEFCPGESLDQMIRRDGPPPPSQIRQIAGQVAAALHYAHSRDVVHRDIKPSNVMLQPDGIVKLMDFGLANPIDADSNSDPIAGTPRYMAPEQLAGESVDTRADLFSLGCTLYRLVTGKTLLPESSLSAIRKRHRKWKVPQNVSDDPELSTFISACLQNKPKDRTADLQTAISWVSR